jgi:hypothetical protein
MSKSELSIAKRFEASLSDCEYTNWTKIASKFGNTELNYRVWGKMILEGILKQGYARKSLNKHYVRVASNPLYRLA